MGLVSFGPITWETEPPSDTVRMQLAPRMGVRVLAFAQALFYLEYDKKRRRKGDQPGSPCGSVWALIDIKLSCSSLRGTCGEEQATTLLQGVWE